jgi:hypothetical protein
VKEQVSSTSSYFGRRKFISLNQILITKTSIILFQCPFKILIHQGRKNKQKLSRQSQGLISPNPPFNDVLCWYSSRYGNVSAPNSLSEWLGSVLWWIGSSIAWVGPPMARVGPPGAKQQGLVEGWLTILPPMLKSGK